MVGELRKRLSELMERQCLSEPFDHATAWQQFCRWLLDNQERLCAGYIAGGNWHPASVYDVTCSIEDALAMLSPDAPAATARRERVGDLWVCAKANCEAGHIIRIAGVTIQLSARREGAA